MLKIIFLIIVALIPFLLSFWLIRRTKQRFQARIRQIRHSTAYHPSELTYRVIDTEEQSYFIGDISCRFNARSPYLRCAINPDGPCEGCSAYESTNVKNNKYPSSDF